MSKSSKILLLVLIIAGTFFYSHYNKKKFDSMKGDQGLVLKNFPEITFKTFDLGSENLRDLPTAPLLNKYKKGIFVHLWGTWCGPCEIEFPAFVEFARKFEGKGVGFLVLAVNDDLKKVNKFLKRFGDLPSNITLALDIDGKSLDYFGTAKVPETYLFNSKGRHLNKFVGPQEWKNPSYFDRSMGFLNKTKTVPVKQYSTN